MITFKKAKKRKMSNSKKNEDQENPFTGLGDNLENDGKTDATEIQKSENSKKPFCVFWSDLQHTGFENLEPVYTIGKNKKDGRGN